MAIGPVEIASTGILEKQKLRCYNGSMQKNSRSLAHLTDAQLIIEVKMLAAGEREATARLIASLAEPMSESCTWAKASGLCSPIARSSCTCRSTPRITGSRRHAWSRNGPRYSTGSATDR